jgi:putative DNA primase/helicase
MTRATLSPGVQACVGRDLARQVAIKHEPSPPPAPKPNGNGRAAAPDDGYVPQGELASAISEIITECAADITPERITWLWKEWLALGKLHLIAGVPEAGKTTIALAFAAIQTSGGTWPDGTHARPGNVLMWTSEDDLADTLVPRLIRMGADLNHIHFVKQTKQTDGKPRPFNPSIDMPALQAKAITIGNIVMLIIDPVVAVMPGNRDSHKGAETRSGLQPLLNFTETINCVTIGVAHLTKGTAGQDPLERINGSGAFGQLPRVVLFAAKNDAEGDDEPERIMVRVKSNIGQSGGGFGYHIDAAPLIENPEITATRIVWENPLEGTARELLGNAEEDSAKLPKLEKAKQFLQSYLANAERLQKEVQAAALAEGISGKTLWRASKEMNIGKRKEGSGGGWLWSLT